MVTLASRMLTSPHVRLVWAKAPGVICLLPPCHQGDDDEVHQDQVHGVNDDDGVEGQSYLDSDRTPCLVKLMISSLSQNNVVSLLSLRIPPVQKLLESNSKKGRSMVNH